MIKRWMMRKSDRTVFPFVEDVFDKGNYRVLDQEEYDDIIAKETGKPKRTKAPVKPKAVEVEEAVEPAQDPIEMDINLSSMSKDQLVAYAKEHFNVRLKRSLSQQEMMDAVAAAMTGLEIPENSEEEGPANV